MLLSAPALHDSVLSTVGDTPVVRIRRLAPEGVRLYAKLESRNPLGSVKDRLALGIVEDAERRGMLRSGQTVIEATSGNTGIGLAMVCAAKGYPLVVVMPENCSVERRRILRFFGARVVLTPAPLRATGMLAKAEELAAAHGWFLCRQFENEANADVHSETTAREILRDFEGERLDYWVTGFGSGGTLKGIARVLKSERPDTRVVACEPRNSRILASGVAQPRAADGRPSDSHPAFRAHPVQGWAADFVPKLAEDAAALVDEFVPVDGADAMRASRELARQEGIFAGISSGATLAGALEVCRRAPPGSTVLCMLPDTGERYMSTPLFDGIATEMTEEELEISRSTPGARFDAAAAPPPPAPAEPAPADAVAFVDAAVSSRAEPVVMFALEWCEFCWSVRKLFRACGVPFRSIDLDAAELEATSPAIRAALAERTGARTVPQVFVGGELIGGCTETLDAFDSGALERALAAQGISTRTIDARGRDFMPAWLQTRR